ncbi:hypothetical protein D3C78_1401470 [compost metagenome]
MLPLAPGLFSMITAWPSESPMDCARMRAITSVLPPGAKPTTMRIVLAGQAAAVCACSAPAAPSAHRDRAAWTQRRIAVFLKGKLIVVSVMVRGMACRFRPDRPAASRAA